MYTTNFENIEKAEKHPSNHTVEKEQILGFGMKKRI